MRKYVTVKCCYRCQRTGYVGAECYKNKFRPCCESYTKNYDSRDCILKNNPEKHVCTNRIERQPQSLQP